MNIDASFLSTTSSPTDEIDLSNHFNEVTYLTGDQPQENMTPAQQPEEGLDNQTWQTFIEKMGEGPYFPPENEGIKEDKSNTHLEQTIASIIISTALFFTNPNSPFNQPLGTIRPTPPTPPITDEDIWRMEHGLGPKTGEDQQHGDDDLEGGVRIPEPSLILTEGLQRTLQKITKSPIIPVTGATIALGIGGYAAYGTYAAWAAGSLSLGPIGLAAAAGIAAIIVGKHLLNSFSNNENQSQKEA